MCSQGTSYTSFYILFYALPIDLTLLDFTSGYCFTYVNTSRLIVLHCHNFILLTQTAIIQLTSRSFTVQSSILQSHSYYKNHIVHASNYKNQYIKIKNKNFQYHSHAHQVASLMLLSQMPFTVTVVCHVVTVCLLLFHQLSSFLSTLFLQSHALLFLQMLQAKTSNFIWHREHNSLEVYAIGVGRCDRYKNPGRPRSV